ncbi:hypothetical protein D3C73_1242920 [compost metagenome]
MVVHRIADAVALPSGAAQRQQRGQRFMHMAARKGIDEQELALASAHVFHQQVAGRWRRRQLRLQRQQRRKPARLHALVVA